MNKDFTTILAAATLVLTTGCVTAGTWVNGCYIDGPLCTVCDGTKVVTHAYGTTVCTHCDGTGIEPPEETVVVENNVIMDTVICDTWSPPPPRWHGHRPRVHCAPPRHIGGRHEVRPAHPAGGARPPRRAARAPAPRQTRQPARPAARPAAPRGGGRRGGR